MSEGGVTDSNHDTKVLFYKAFNVQGQITLMAKEYRHSKRACETLEEKMKESHKYVEELLASYDTNLQYFSNQRYYQTFQSYIKVLETVLEFLGDFEKKAMFMRFIQRDRYKRTIFNLLEEVDRSISALKYGLSLRVSTSYSNEQFSLENISAEMDSSNDKFDLLKSGIDGSDGQREQLILDIQLAEKGNLDILKAVEISDRRIKEMPREVARQGRNFAVFKRAYEGKEVAEKVYRASIKDERLLDSIRKQVAILKKLEVCPYIIRFYGIRRKTHSFGLVTEFAALGTLKELIDSQHVFDKTVKANITTGIVEGVAFLHNLDIIHKNIKTSSVMINGDMTAKLSGFEFSREVSAATEQVVDLGSDRYRWIPPEKLHSLIDSTPKGDIYSVGMTLWSLWTSLYPYRNMKDRSSVEEYIKQGGSEDLSLISAAMRPVIELCFHENPGRRPTANELINELDLALPKELDRDSINEGSSSSSPFSTLTSGIKPIGPVSAISTTFSNGADKLASGIDKSNNNNILSNSWVESPRDIQNNIFQSARNSQGSNTEVTSSYAAGYFRPNSSSGSTDHITGPTISNITSQSSQSGTGQLQHSSQPMSHNGLRQPSRPQPIAGFMETRIESNDLNEIDELADLLQVVTMDEAVIDHNEGRYQEAFNKFLQINQAKEPRSDYFLGYYYFWGQPNVVEKNLDIAVSYLKKAVEYEDSDAMDLLGMAYRESDYRGKDLKLAVHYFQKAADLGNRKGLYHLFTAYAAGRGVSKDPAKAKEYLIKAAQLGYPSAIQQANRLKISY